MSALYDYSTHVELLLHEEDACLHMSLPSDEDYARTVPRLWSAIETAGTFVGGPGIEIMFAVGQQRNRLFDSFDDGTVASRAVRPPHDGWLRGACTFCGAEQRCVREEKDGERSISVSACPDCGWWQSEDMTLKKAADHYDAFLFCRRAVLREFAISDVEVPLTSVRRHLDSDRYDLRLISPTVLERLVGDVLADHFNCEVRHVGGPGDGGIDLLAVNTDEPWAVQVKRRGPTVRTESVRPVREFIGALVVSGHRNGLFVTTAPCFSRPAVATAEQVNDSLSIDRVELLDFAALTSIMELHPAPDAWEIGAPSVDQPVGDYSPHRRIFTFEVTTGTAKDAAP